MFRNKESSSILLDKTYYQVLVEYIRKGELSNFESDAKSSFREAEGIATQAAEAISSLYPGSKITGTEVGDYYHLLITKNNNDEIIAKIKITATEYDNYTLH